MNLDGKYRLIAELGQGGMAVVHLAVVQGSMGFQKLAVIKLLRSGYASDPDFVQMFLDEARLCARLSHPNIVHTYEVGVDAGKHYLAMEFLDGVSLYAATSLARKGGPFTVPMQARVLLDVLDGLKYAHELRDFAGKELKVVHRDVSPHNVFITFDGQVKLLDFGIAKVATSSVETAAGVIKGKLTYMSPEQARGEPIDGRADLHAVGVMLWEAIAGRRRWPANMAQPALFASLASGDMPRAPGGCERGLPAEFDRVALRGADPRESERYQTAGEFHRELELALRQIEPVSLRDVGAMLREAFAEDRKRLHRVIEQQVQEIASGRAPTLVSDLPTVRPVGRRGEHSDAGEERASLASPGLAAQAHDRTVGQAAAAASSFSEAAVTSATRPAVRGGPRSVLGASIMVAAVLAGIGGALHERGPTPQPSSSGLSFGELRLHPARSLGDGERPTDARAAAQRPSVDAALVASSPTAISDEPDKTSLSPPKPRSGELPGQSARSAPRRHHTPSARPVAAEAKPSLAEPTPLAPPPPPSVTEPTRDHAPSLRHPTDKPKVQLDQDNPWK